MTMLAEQPIVLELQPDGTYWIRCTEHNPICESITYVDGTPAMVYHPEAIVVRRDGERELYRCQCCGFSWWS